MMFHFPKGEFVFKKLKPLRPTVIRKGEVVKVCYYHKGTKKCLGARCYWAKVGKCPILTRIRINAK
jgi:hypothetical protein